MLLRIKKRKNKLTKEMYRYSVHFLNWARSYFRLIVKKKEENYEDNNSALPKGYL